MYHDCLSCEKLALSHVDVVVDFFNKLSITDNCVPSKTDIYIGECRSGLVPLLKELD